MLLIDARGAPIGYKLVAIGGTSRLSVTAADVFRPALVAGAAAMVMAHNHPSGQVEPTKEDLEFTHTIVAAAKVVGVDLLDHLIVARRAFLSLRERGVLTASAAQL